MVRRLPRRFALLVLVLATTAASVCSKAASPVSPSPTPREESPFLEGASVIVGAGDIGWCDSPGAEATAKLLDRLPGIVFTTGDNAYMSGTLDEYMRCYEPSWGRHRRRTKPTAGNHEYGSGGSGYFGYFGGAAGPPGQGYYSYGVGAWRVIALNSEIPSGPGSPQHDWLRAELARRRTTCTAVLWHRPLFTSGRNGNNPDMRDVWRTLHEFNVDLVINGHDHTYERFAPQDPDGRPDPARGIRQFIVGTGGAPLYEFVRVQANSEARAAVWGVAMFTLSDDRYEWQFLPVEGQGFHDAGSAACH